MTPKMIKSTSHVLVYLQDSDLPGHGGAEVLSRANLWQTDGKEEISN